MIERNYIGQFAQERIVKIVDRDYWLDGIEYEKHIYVHCIIICGRLKETVIACEYVEARRVESNNIEEPVEACGYVKAEEEQATIELYEGTDWPIEDMSGKPVWEAEESIDADFEQLKIEDIEAGGTAGAGGNIRNSVAPQAAKHTYDPIFNNAISDMKWISRQGMGGKIDNEVSRKLEEIEEQLKDAATSGDWNSAATCMLTNAALWFNTKRAVRKKDMEFAATAIAEVLRSCNYDGMPLSGLTNNVVKGLNVKQNAESKTWDVMFKARSVLGYTH